MQQVKIFSGKFNCDSDLEKEINEWLKKKITKGTIKDVLSTSLSVDSNYGYFYAIIAFTCSPDYVDDSSCPF
ncbi:MAG: hypothetical protein WC511_05725 [Candidatus Pacearchaeota archaeon]